MKRLIIALALVPTLAMAADTTKWPHVCVPAVLNGGVAIKPELIVGLTLGLPEVFENTGGYAAMWGCRDLMTAAVLPQEVHATYDWIAAHAAWALQLKTRTPLQAFWDNAKTSSCYDPKGYWPTSQERTLCDGVRKAWTAWGLK